MAGGSRKTADFRLVAALASGATYEDAAEAADVSERTVYRRMSDPEFRSHLYAARARYLNIALGTLADASTELVTMLLEMARGAESENVRLGAIRTALEASHRLREATEIGDRIAALEDRLRIVSQPRAV